MPNRAPLVILDEAHRASTEATERYVRLADVTHGARVLLVSATPVRNSSREVAALLKSDAVDTVLLVPV